MEEKRIIQSSIFNLQFMKRIVLNMLLLLVSLATTAVDMKDVFTAMPDSVLPTLTRNNRLDMIDFVASGMKA